MIDLKKIAEEIAIGKAGSVESWLLPIADIEQMIELIRKQETALREIQGRMGAMIVAKEATVKESLNVAGEMPALPWGDDFEAWIEVRGADEVGAELKAYAAIAIAAARPAIWYEGCDTALANKVSEGTGGAAPAADLSGLLVYNFNGGAREYFAAADVRALLGVEPVAITTREWPEAERISNLPAVHEAIQGFADDLTGDNAVMIVREVMRELAKIGGVR